MTQPQLQLIVCNECGSVRVPVPAIVSKVMTLSMQQTVSPCPVCTLINALCQEPEPTPESVLPLREA